jgi:hypothetical protein
MLLVGTSAGMFEVGGGRPSTVLDRPVTCVAWDGGRWWALADQRDVLVSDDAGGTWPLAATVPDGLVGYCIDVSPDGGVVVGTSEAHVLRLAADGLEADPSFDAIPTRDEWYTPWGAPPDTRSLSIAADGTAFVNVHVGGVWRSGGDGWDERVEVDADTHQVLAVDGVVLVAAAVGFGSSDDGGETFTWSTDGLHDTYARAVALTEDGVLLTASTGPRTAHAAVYRRPFDGGPFEKVHDGLPEWFGSNIDTYCLAAKGDTATFGTGDGDVFVSSDAGRSWEILTGGLPPVRCVALA